MAYVQRLKGLRTTLDDIIREMENIPVATVVSKGKPRWYNWFTRKRPQNATPLSLEEKDIQNGEYPSHETDALFQTNPTEEYEADALAEGKMEAKPVNSIHFGGRIKTRVKRTKRKRTRRR